MVKSYPWHYRIEHTHRKSEDSQIPSDDSFCPCGSLKKYADCCKNDPEGIKEKVYIFAPGMDEND